MTEKRITVSDISGNFTEKRITVNDISRDFGDLFKDIPTPARARTANAPEAHLAGPALAPVPDHPTKPIAPTVDDIFGFKVDFGDIFKDIPTTARARTASAPEAHMTGPALAPAPDRPTKPAAPMTMSRDTPAPCPEVKRLTDALDFFLPGTTVEIGTGGAPYGYVHIHEVKVCLGENAFAKIQPETDGWQATIIRDDVRHDIDHANRQDLVEAVRDVMAHTLMNRTASASSKALEAARAEGRAEMMGRVQAWAEGDGARAYGEVTAHFLRAAVAKMLADLGSGDG